MIFGGFMVHDKMIKLLWKWFHAIYEKNTYTYIYIYVYIYINIYIYIVHSTINEITQMQMMQIKGKEILICFDKIQEENLYKYY